jgi:hypothetical protein
MNAPTRELHERLPDDTWATEQVQQALTVLCQYHNEAWECGRAARQEKADRLADAWLDHAASCELRAIAYDADAARFPAAHKDHHHYRQKAQEQREKAASARRWADIERARA